MINHGISGYRRLKCRCATCRKANALYMHEWKNRPENMEKIKERQAAYSKTQKAKDIHKRSIIKYMVSPKYKLAKLRRRVAQYGITIDQYNSILESQDGKCAGCGSIYNLCIDHDHETGMVRGILCHDCNSSIGRMGDNIKTLENLIGYLLK